MQVQFKNSGTDMVWFPKAAEEENPTLEIGLGFVPRGKWQWEPG
jgi:hypothetical protein